MKAPNLTSEGRGGTAAGPLARAEERHRQRVRGEAEEADQRQSRHPVLQQLLQYVASITSVASVSLWAARLSRRL